jgi:hypothetical protein
MTLFLLLLCLSSVAAQLTNVCVKLATCSDCIDAGICEWIGGACSRIVRAPTPRTMVPEAQQKRQIIDDCPSPAPIPPRTTTSTRAPTTTVVDDELPILPTGTLPRRTLPTSTTQSPAPTAISPSPVVTTVDNNVDTTIRATTTTTTTKPGAQFTASTGSRSAAKTSKVEAGIAIGTNRDVEGGTADQIGEPGPNWAVIGGAIGGGVALVAIVAAVVLVVKSRGRRNKSTTKPPPPELRPAAPLPDVRPAAPLPVHVRPAPAIPDAEKCHAIVGHYAAASLVSEGTATTMYADMTMRTDEADDASDV